MSRVTGSREIEDILKRFGLELCSLGDVYITSRYFARDYTIDDVARIRKVVDEVMSIVRRSYC